MTDKKEHFLDFKTFWDTVGKKRSHSGALEDINMLEFDVNDYDPLSDEYIVDVRMKDEYRDGYMINPYLVKNKLVIMENIHLIHGAEWLNIWGNGEIIFRTWKIFLSCFPCRNCS